MSGKKIGRGKEREKNAKIDCRNTNGSERRVGHKDYTVFFKKCNSD